MRSQIDARDEPADDAAGRASATASARRARRRSRGRRSRRRCAPAASTSPRSRRRRRCTAASARRSSEQAERPIATACRVRRAPRCRPPARRRPARACSSASSSIVDDAEDAHADVGLAPADASRRNAARSAARSRRPGSCRWRRSPPRCRAGARTTARCRRPAARTSAALPSRPISTPCASANATMLPRQAGSDEADAEADRADQQRHHHAEAVGEPAHQRCRRRRSRSSAACRAATHRRARRRTRPAPPAAPPTPRTCRTPPIVISASVTPQAGPGVARVGGGFGGHRAIIVAPRRPMQRARRLRLKSVARPHCIMTSLTDAHGVYPIAPDALPRRRPRSTSARPTA